MLHVHYAVGLLLFLTALVAIFYAPARRVCDYVLVLQIVLGAALWLVNKVPPPPVHWILAVAVGGVWPMARVLARRGRPAPVVMGLCALGALVLAYVIYVGMHAVHG
jgi:hypothetical protein